MLSKKWAISAGPSAGNGNVAYLQYSTAGKKTELLDGDIDDFGHFMIMLTAGDAVIYAGLEQSAYPTRPAVLSLEPAVDGSFNVTETQGTFITKLGTNLNKIHHLFGNYRALKVVQNGGTAPVGYIIALER